MMDMQEITVDPPELELIPIERTSLIPADKPAEKITGRQYRRMLRRWALAFGVSLGVNIVQAMMIWVLQVGPI